MHRRSLAWVLLWLPFAPLCAGADDDNAGPPDPVGVWRGELDRGEGAGNHPRQLVLRIRHGNDGYTATLEGLASGAQRLVVENLTLVEDVLSFQVSQVQGRFAGNFSPVGDSLRGTWSQDDQSRVLIFFRD